MRVSHAVWWQGKVIVPAADEAWCVVMCIHACVHTCMRACERASVRAFMHLAYLHESMRTCIHAPMHACMLSLSLSLSLSLTHTHTAHAPIPHHGVQHDAHAHRYPVRLGWRPRASDPDQDEAPVWPREGRCSYYDNVNVSFAHVGRSACVATPGPVFILCKCIIGDM